MPRPRADLVRQALGFLNIVFPGEVATSDDLATIDGHVDGKLAELARRNVYYVQDQTAIEDEAFLPLAKILANAAANEFGLPFNDQSDAREEQRLRSMQSEPGANDVTRALYF